MLHVPDAMSGVLYLVGLGPGDLGLVSPQAVEAIRQSDTVVGFRGYIEQAGSLLDGKEVISMELGQELERAVRAVELAEDGRSVAVVSSGDPGVYGMSGPVFQVLTDRNWDGRSPRVESVPGISAMQAAASLLGSPLMQDFCAISLSDLMTPWQTIRLRLESAARRRFCGRVVQPEKWPPPVAAAGSPQHPDGAPARFHAGGHREGRLPGKPAGYHHRPGPPARPLPGNRHGHHRGGGKLHVLCPPRKHDHPPGLRSQGIANQPDRPLNPSDRPPTSP